MGQSTGSTGNVYHCFFDGCRNDVVCVEVYHSYRREPIHAEHSGICASHAMREGIRILAHCMCDTVYDQLPALAPVDMGESVTADICRSYQ